jgi:DNA-binding NtrC family response regulator
MGGTSSGSASHLVARLPRWAGTTPDSQSPRLPVSSPNASPPNESDQHENSLVPSEFRATLSVLLVDDERTLRETCRSILEGLGYRVEVASKGDEGLKLLRRRTFDILLTDLYLPDVTGLELCQAALERSPDTIVVVMTGNPSVASNVEVLRAGAWDYLPKPFSATHLEIVMGRAAHTIMVARESDTSGESNGGDEDDTPLGVSPNFLRCLELARKVAATDASVFITGETGAGKEMIAQYIHRRSRRRARPLVAVNCAALPEGLLESEMFGHVKGSFTGAVRDKAGLLEAASGSTMFLDELTEMPKALQAKLLRVIQDGVVRRVGSNATSSVVNVRFIAASNRDADAAVRERVLREDLYYRLRVVPIVIPPLRDRPEDVALLSAHYLARYWRQHRGGDTRPPQLTDEAIRALQAYSWPGNVRELQNAIEHAVVVLSPGQMVRAGDIPLHDAGRPTPTRSGSVDIELPGDLLQESYHDARERVITLFERRYIEELVAAAEGNMSKAARIAGVDRTTLYRLMERHGLQRETVVSPNRT